VGDGAALRALNLVSFSGGTAVLVLVWQIEYMYDVADRGLLGSAAPRRPGLL
jgi:hypothetical protein